MILLCLFGCKKEFTCTCTPSSTSYGSGGSSSSGQPTSYSYEGKDKTDALQKCNADHAVESYTLLNGSTEETTCVIN